jgi:uncharacterized membrane protein (DUF106 family)
MVRFIEPIDQTSVEAIRKLMKEVRQKIDGAAKKRQSSKQLNLPRCHN